MIAFRGERFFLSNFYPARVQAYTASGAFVYPTAEHAFVHAKTGWNPCFLSRIVGCTAKEAKRLGRTLPLCEQWASADHRISVMKRIIETKFTMNPDLGLRLRNLVGPIVELNEWHDTFWGQCTCPRCQGRGENWLGKILTEVRFEITPPSQQGRDA